MMTKIKSYNFWVKLVSAIILIARIILAKFGYELDSALVIDIATLIAGLLVVLGIINEPTGITFSYNESENNSIKNQIKGDNSMTEQIKIDLMSGVRKLTDAIDSNDNSDMSNVIQIITGMLEVIAGAEENMVAETAEQENHSTIEEEIVQDQSIEPVQTIEIESDIKEEQETDEEPHEDEASKNAEEETSKEVSEETFATAYSVVKGNEEAMKMIKEYVINHIDEILAS